MAEATWRCPPHAGRNTWEDSSWATDREMTWPRVSPFSFDDHVAVRHLAAVGQQPLCDDGLGPLPQTILVYRLVESTPGSAPCPSG